MQQTANILFVPHGGGPLPLLNDANHATLTHYLRTVADKLITPKAIIVVTAHWEGRAIQVSTNPNPGMLFDYYGFPEETYQYQYAAPGQPELAEQIIAALNSAGIAAQADSVRGFDHGTFVPLMLMYPRANVPVIQLSIHASLDPLLHLNLGKALAPLLQSDVLLLGSGLSFHNMRAFGDANALAKSQRFDAWLAEQLNQQGHTAITAMLNWLDAPEARYCHPREEHLIPLHVCVGAALALNKIIKQDFSTVLMGTQVSAFIA